MNEKIIELISSLDGFKMCLERKNYLDYLQSYNNIHNRIRIFLKNKLQTMVSFFHTPRDQEELIILNNNDLQ